LKVQPNGTKTRLFRYRRPEAIASHAPNLTTKARQFIGGIATHGFSYRLRSALTSW
jgi:hypothetical protein